MGVSDLFWSASQEELKRGYVEKENDYICLLCGKKVEKGIIYPDEGILYEAGRYIRVHIEKEHRSVFEHLIHLDKKLTGLSEHQNNLLKLFYENKSDAEIQKEMGIGSSSTIRNHRFVLREKERQAKVFLVLMELLKEGSKKSPGLIPPHKTARMVDDRYSITEDENEKILKKYFSEGIHGPLKTFDMQQKHRLVVLRQIVKRFVPGSTYSEKEVNEILKSVYEDFVTIRRYLIDYGFMDRKPDCSQYWLKEGVDGTEEEAVERKKELIQQYKEMKKEAGVYQIRNTKNQKILVLVTPDLKTMNGKRFQLEMGGFMNKQLQEEWKQFGADAFEFEVLEVLEEKEEGFFDKKEELKKLEKKWLEKLQPYGERGYNPLHKERDTVE
ncbi:MAG: DUF2087 domain-containing protein [Clostridia bacterium]|nr:DUF2087 domain-containing protein [Clostridia bacterium]